MLKLKFNLRHQDIQLVNKGAVVATDSKDYLVAKFNTISDDWEAPLTAVFTDDKHNQPYAVVVGADERLAEDECFVPWEVLADAANVYVSVYCGNLHTTVTAAFKVRKSGYIEGETPPPPSPTVYDTIMQSIENLRTGKQDKLTAGENITIDENGVISAEGGGVTSYTELTDKPVISASDPTESVKPKWTLTNELDFASREFNGNHDVSGRIIISIDKLFPRFSLGLYSYDFNNIGTNPLSSYNGYLNFENGITHVSNFPAALSDLDTSKTFFVYQSFKTTYTGDRLRYMLRKVIGQSLTGEYLEYAQFCRIRYSELSAEVVSQTDWVKLSGGGSEIVSGVVNQNGTITFTDSDGNTFTTSGSSVIGADGFSPTATVTQTQSGATVTITDKNGTTTANISNGNDYVLTPQDKTDIANIVLQLLPTTEGVLYGN